MAYTQEQWDYLKKLGLMSLGVGASIPALKHLVNGYSPAVLPEALGYSAYLPVVGMDSEPEGVDLSKEMGRKSDKRSKKLKDFKPGKDYEVKEKSEKTASNMFSWSNLTNPEFLPGVVAATGGPGILSYLALDRLLKQKRKRDLQDDEDIAREAFNKTLVETSASKLNNPTEAVKTKAASVSETIVKELDELADLCIKKAQKSPQIPGVTDVSRDALADPYIPASERALGSAFGIGKNPERAKAVVSTIDSVADAASKALEGGKNVASDLLSWGAKALLNTAGATHNFLMSTDPGRVALGLTGALALLGGGIGTYHGLRKARAEDKGPYESNRYLAEFLQRQQEQGAPIYITPTPIPSAKKQENNNPIAHLGR